MKIELSKGAKALTKAEAYRAIMRLRAGEELYGKDLDGLLLYFAPAIPKKPKSNMDWLSMACSTKATSQDVMRFIHVHNGRGYSSDGHRAHCAPVDLVDGCYCPKTHALVEGRSNQWEMLDRVLTIPKDAVKFGVDDLEKEVIIGQKDLDAVYRPPGANPINPKYFEQAISIGKPDALFVPIGGRTLYGKVGDNVFCVAGLQG